MVIANVVKGDVVSKDPNAVKYGLREVACYFSQVPDSVIAQFCKESRTLTARMAVSHKKIYLSPLPMKNWGTDPIDKR